MFISFKSVHPELLKIYISVSKQFYPIYISIRSNFYHIMNLVICWIAIFFYGNRRFFKINFWCLSLKCEMGRIFTFICGVFFLSGINYRILTKRVFRPCINQRVIWAPRCFIFISVKLVYQRMRFWSILIKYRLEMCSNK